MTGVRTMDDFACIMVAKILGIDGMIVIAAAQMAREKNQARKDVGEDRRKKMGARALGGLAAEAMLMGSLSADNASAPHFMANALLKRYCNTPFVYCVK
ncbi:hypothetical protein DB032_13900 [Chromobacterium sp. Panama]|nr:hypothetical protein DB032_13900 [Chromobacterium sp. Panama]